MSMLMNSRKKSRKKFKIMNYNSIKKILKNSQRKPNISIRKRESQRNKKKSQRENISPIKV